MAKVKVLTTFVQEAVIEVPDDIEGAALEDHWCKLDHGQIAFSRPEWASTEFLNAETSESLGGIS